MSVTPTQVTALHTKHTANQATSIINHINSVLLNENGVRIAYRDNGSFVVNGQTHLTSANISAIEMAYTTAGWSTAAITNEVVDGAASWVIVLTP